jgi:N-methylhydantoinase A
VRSGATRASVRLWHGGAETEGVLLAGEPAPGERIDGPAVCALSDATLLITPGWRGRVLADGTIELTRS